MDKLNLLENIMRYRTSFKFKRLLVKTRNLNITQVIEYLSTIKLLNKVILFLVIFIVLFFFTTLYKLIFGTMEFNNVIAPIIFSLAALLASVVAITNMRQTYNFEILKSTKADVDLLRLLAVTGHTLQLEILSLENAVSDDGATTKYFLQRFNSLAIKYEEQMFQKGVMSLIDNDTLRICVNDVFFSLRLITENIAHILDLHFQEKNVVEQSFILESKEDSYMIKLIKDFEKSNKEFLLKLDVITDDRVKVLRKMIKRER